MEEQYINLSPEEKEKPMLVLEQLFDGYDIATYQQELWELLKAAMSVEAWSFLQSPGMAPRFAQSLNRLMESCQLMLQQYEAEHGELALQLWVKSSEEHLEEERKNLVNRHQIRYAFFGLVNRMNVDEIEEPLKAVKAFFAHADLVTWKAWLAEWVAYSLDALAMIEGRADSEDLVHLEYFQKLMEAAWLIFMKSHLEDWTNFIHGQYTQVLDIQPYEPIVSRRLFDAFFLFIKAIPPVRLNRNLRKIFLGYLQGNHHMIPLDFEEYLIDLEFLTELLDVAEKDTQFWYHEDDMYGA